MATDLSSVSIILKSENTKVPLRGSSESAGTDLYAATEHIIQPGDRTLVSTDIIMKLPSGTYGQIAPRSSMAVKGIDIGAGIIDSDYRGEIKVLLINASKTPFAVNIGERIAQILILPVISPKYHIYYGIPDNDVLDTERGAGGFGSTGK